MKISLAWLREKNACAEGIAWFKKQFGQEAQYQAVLDALAAEDRASWARWLLARAGATDAVLRLPGLKSEHSFFFAGTIIVEGRILAGQ